MGTLLALWFLGFVGIAADGELLAAAAAAPPPRRRPTGIADLHGDRGAVSRGELGRAAGRSDRRAGLSAREARRHPGDRARRPRHPRRDRAAAAAAASARADRAGGRAADQAEGAELRAAVRARQLRRGVRCRGSARARPVARRARCVRSHGGPTIACVQASLCIDNVTHSWLSRHVRRRICRTVRRCAARPDRARHCRCRSAAPRIISAPMCCARSAAGTPTTSPRMPTSASGWRGSAIAAVSFASDHLRGGADPLRPGCGSAPAG